MLEPHLVFTQLVIDWQPRLYGFVLSLVGNANEADDVLQNVNVALLRKQEHFALGSDFAAWALQVAYFEVQAHRKSNQRARHRFSDVVIEQLAAVGSISSPSIENADGLEVHPTAGGWDTQRGALRKCLESVPPRQRDLIERRYGGESLDSISKRVGRPASSLSQTLYRLRGRLADCIRRRLSAEQHGERRHES